LEDAGSFLGRGEGCLIVRDRKGKVEKYPLFEDEIGEIQIRIGNSVSSGPLATCAFWGIGISPVFSSEEPSRLTLSGKADEPSA
jgi:hypothetical protein